MFINPIFFHLSIGNEHNKYFVPLLPFQFAEKRKPGSTLIGGGEEEKVC
jgi:hypothetical protein